MLLSGRVKQTPAFLTLAEQLHCFAFLPAFGAVYTRRRMFIQNACRRYAIDSTKYMFWLLSTNNLNHYLYRCRIDFELIALFIMSGGYRYELM